MKKILSLLALFLFITPFSFSQDDPVAVNDTVHLMQYGTVSVNVLANDYDPNDEAIHIYEIDDDDRFVITYVDSVVTIAMIDYYGVGVFSIRYKIRNESGENDRAYIIVFIEENPDVPITVRDVFVMDSQTEMTMDLLVNDEYSGTEELIINQVSSSVEVLEDNRTVKVTATESTGVFDFSYSIKEVGGNAYVSKIMRNSIYVHQNPNQPIAKVDSFQIFENEIILLDVLQNDFPEENLMIYSVSTDQAEIIDNKIQYTPPQDYYGPNYFKYNVKNNENDLLSSTTKVYLDILPSSDRPIAVNDTLVFPFLDTIYLSPLLNDMSPSGRPLFLNEAEDSLIAFYRHLYFGSGHYDRSYTCLDIETGIRSEPAEVFYQILPPDSIELIDLAFDYTIGDTLRIDLSLYTNFNDTISRSASCRWGTAFIEDNFLVYYFEEIVNDDVQTFFYENTGSLNEEISVTYSMGDQYPMKHTQTIEINYIQVPLVNFLTVNNFKNRVTPYGILSASNNYPDPMRINGIEYPKNTGVNTLSFINPWLANRSDETIAIGEQYHKIGYQFFSGPLADNYDGDYLEKYFRTWKIDKTEIDRHIIEFANTAYEIPEVIKNWPAGIMEYNGSMYEQADFVDLNENGIYEPEQGEYPKISGDQAILYIVNNGRFQQDSYYPNYLSDSLNIDMYVLVYAFDRPESEIFQNTFFMKYKIINKSDTNYEDFRFGQWVRVNERAQRYLGSDSLLNTFYFYPAYNHYYEMNSFNLTSHMECITFLNKKMDKFTSTDMNSIYFGYLEKYNFMNGTWADTLVSGNFPPDWIDKAPLNYCYPSNPSDPYGWSQVTDGYFAKNNEKGDPGNRGVGTSGPHFLGTGEKLEFDLAFHINKSSDNGYFEFIDESLNNIEQLIECYQNDSIPGGGSFSQIEEGLSPSSPIAQIYPNPAHTTLHIQTDYNDFKYYRIYSIYGQLVEERKFIKQINIEYLQDGFYLIQLLNGSGDALVTHKFVKQ